MFFYYSHKKVVFLIGLFKWVNYRLTGCVVKAYSMSKSFLHSFICFCCCLVRFELSDFFFLSGIFICLFVYFLFVACSNQYALLSFLLFYNSLKWILSSLSFSISFLIRNIIKFIYIFCVIFLYTWDPLFTLHVFMYSIIRDWLMGNYFQFDLY